MGGGAFISVSKLQNCAFCTALYKVFYGLHFLCFSLSSEFTGIDSFHSFPRRDYLQVVRPRIAMWPQQWNPTQRNLSKASYTLSVNPLNPKLNPICYLLALLAHCFPHVSRIRVKSLTLRLLMSYIYGAPILDVSRSHTTTQHSR